MREGEDPPGKIVEDEETRKACDERQVLLDRLAAELPEIVFPQSERTIDPCCRLNGHQADGRKMADAEQGVSYYPPLAEGPYENECLTTHRKEHVQKVKHHKKICEGTVKDFHATIAGTEVSAPARPFFRFFANLSTLLRGNDN